MVTVKLNAAPAVAVAVGALVMVGTVSVGLADLTVKVMAWVAVPTPLVALTVTA